MSWPRLGPAADRSLMWYVVAACAATVGGRRGRRSAQRGLLSVALASAISHSVLRPLARRLDPALGTTGKSSLLPSSHAAVAVAYTTATAMEAPIAAAPAAALAAGVVSSRLSTDDDSPLGVLSGAAVGALVAAGTTRLWPLIDPAPARTKPTRRQLLVEPSVSGKGLVVVANAAAGPAAHEDDLSAIADAFPDADIVTVEDPDELVSTLNAAAADATALGILGGDGTIGAATAAAQRADIPLTVFPGGTLNHFARDLGIESVDDAITALRHGQLVEVDVATIDGRAFLNTASFGTYSDFVDAREAYEGRIGKWPAVAVALTKVLLSGQPFSATIDGRTRAIWMIFIGNCAYDPPGFAPATRQRLDDGKLDVRIVDGTEPWARLKLVAAVLTGQLARSQVYTRRLTTHLDITIPRLAAERLAADGETFSGSSSFAVTKTARRLRTYAPHD